MQVNGGPPEQGLEDHVARATELSEKLIGELRELLTEEEQVHLQLTQQLDESRTRRDRARKALEQLTGEAAKYGKGKAKPGPKPKDSHGWAVSEQTVEKVLVAIRQVTEPTTMTQLSGELKMGGETIRKAMEVLRERELVRITGVTRGGGKLYLPMPTEAETEAA